MKDYTEVDCQERLENLLDAMSGFHDSMTKEVHVENVGYVDCGGSMIRSHQFNIRILIQSQFQPHAIEMVFYKASSLALSGPGEHGSGNGEVKTTGLLAKLREITLDLDGSTIVTAERMYWRQRPEWVGRIIRFSGPVPSPEAIPSKTMEGKWRQCSGCCDAWEEALDKPFSYSPSCRRLTELDGCGPDVRNTAPALLDLPPVVMPAKNR